MSVTSNSGEKVSLQRKGANEAEMESGRGEKYTRRERFTKSYET